MRAELKSDVACLAMKKDYEQYGGGYYIDANNKNKTEVL